MGKMVRGGWSSHEGCNQIYQVYGQNSDVTYIINEMRNYRKNGGNPALRITKTEIKSEFSLLQNLQIFIWMSGC